MKVIDVTTDDGKKCSQLMNFLKIVDLPKDLKVADCVALTETMGWLNGLVKQIAEQLHGQSKNAPPVIPPPVPKKGKK